MTATELLGTRVCEGTVLPGWIDYNQHMNVAYYLMAFDLAIDGLWREFGITEDYIAATRGSTFAVECHVMYQRELHEGDPYVVTAQVLAYDDKRIHQFQRLYHAEKGFLSATAEWMNLHVDLDSRRVSPWPQPVLDRIARFASAQAGQVRPEDAGRQMSIRQPLYRL